jgi:hypothetical protein
MHFEELWEKCESLQKDSANEQAVTTMIDELIMKLKLYQILDKKEIPAEEYKTIKSRTMGEILWALTKLSLKDNINVFEALGSAYQFHGIGHFNQKYNMP